MAISSNHTSAQLQSATTAFDFIKIPNPPGGTINSNYSIGAYPTFILIKPDKQIVEKDIWPIDNSILRNKITTAGGVAQSCGSTSINNTQQNKNDLIIYPNPAFNTINIIFKSKPLSKYNVDICNIIGQTLKNYEFISNSNGEINEVLNLSELKSGNYFIKIQNNHSIITERKFVIIK